MEEGWKRVTLVDISDQAKLQSPFCQHVFGPGGALE